MGGREQDTGTCRATSRSKAACAGKIEERQAVNRLKKKGNRRDYRQRWPRLRRHSRNRLKRVEEDRRTTRGHDDPCAGLDGRLNLRHEGMDDKISGLSTLGIVVIKLRVLVKAIMHSHIFTCRHPEEEKVYAKGDNHPSSHLGLQATELHYTADQISVAEIYCSTYWHHINTSVVGLSCGNVGMPVMPAPGAWFIFGLRLKLELVQEAVIEIH